VFTSTEVKLVKFTSIPGLYSDLNCYSLLHDLIVGKQLNIELRDIWIRCIITIQ